MVKNENELFSVNLNDEFHQFHKTISLGIFYFLSYIDCTVSPEKPPIVGYTGHIPGAKGEVALSKGYTQAAKKGLELVRKEREQRLNKTKDVHPVQRVLDAACVDETGHTRA